MLYEVSPSAGYMPTVLTMVNRAKLTAPRLIASIGQLYGDFSWAPLRNGAESNQYQALTINPVRQISRHIQLRPMQVDDDMNKHAQPSVST